jgi:EmrB/QacA subfamily drug resistance transporter
MSRKGWVLGTVACGTFMATLDSSIVNIALPTLVKSLNADLRSIKWVVIVYLLTITCTLLPFGRLSDLYGRKRAIQVGFGIFTLGSLFCGVSLDLTQLICSRIFQGLGAALMMANGPALVTAYYEKNERGRALGLLAMVVSTGLVAGPSLGGFLITHVGWRGIFFVNLPMGILGAFLARRKLLEEVGKRLPGPFDWGGAFFQFMTLLVFVFFVDPPTLSGFGLKGVSIPFWLMGVMLAALGWMLYNVEKQVPEPILDFSLFKNRNFLAANGANFLNFVAYSSLLVLMPFYLEQILNFSPEHAGLLMSGIPITIFVIAPISGLLADRYGTKTLSIFGASISATSLLWMSGIFGSGLTNSISQQAIVVVLCAIGLSSGLFQSPNNVTIMSSIPPDKLGIASALMATIRNLGLVTGTGVSAKVFSWRFSKTDDFLDAFHFSLLIAGLISVGTLIVSCLKKEVRAESRGSDG